MSNNSKIPNFHVQREETPQPLSITVSDDQSHEVCIPDNTDQGVYPQNQTQMPYGLYPHQSAAMLGYQLTDTMQKIAFESQYKVFVDYLKTENSKELAKYKDDIRSERELAIPMLSVDQNGCIRYGICKPNGKCSYSEPIFSVRNIKTTILRPNDRDDCLYLISWDSCEKPIIIKEMISKKLAKALEKAGVAISLTRRQKTTVMDLLIAYLTKNANKITLPRTKGWNLMENEGECMFRWVKEGEDTYDKFCRAAEE